MFFLILVAMLAFSVLPETPIYAMNGRADELSYEEIDLTMSEKTRAYLIEIIQKMRDGTLSPDKITATTKRNVLHYALLLKCSDVGIIKDLISCGVPLNVVDGLGCTPLCYAVYMGYRDVAILLLDAGADPFLASQNAFSAFDYMHSNDQFKIYFKDVLNYIFERILSASATYDSNISDCNLEVRFQN